MKRIFLALCLLVLCITVSSGGITDKLKSVIARKNVAGNGNGDCPAGTYDRSWDGDHSTSTVTVCTNSGAGTDTLVQNNGTIDPAFGNAGNGYRMDSNNDYMTDSTFADFDATTGTIWVYIRVPDDFGDRPDTAVFMEWSDQDADGANHLWVRVQNAANKIRIEWTGNTTSENITSNSLFTANTWTWIGYSYDRSGVDKHSVKIGANAWEEVEEVLTAMSVAIDEMVIGERRQGGAFTEDVDIDEVTYIGGTYQAANPYA